MRPPSSIHEATAPTRNDEKKVLEQLEVAISVVFLTEVPVYLMFEFALVAASSPRRKDLSLPCSTRDADAPPTR